MLLELFRAGSKDELITAIIMLLISLPVILLSLSFHEAAHAFAAHKLGDRTARNLGRLTMNPAKHLDLMGTLCMLICGVGWAKPVPINTRYFKNPKWGMALSALAGPLSNLLLSLLGTVFVQLTIRIAVVAEIPYAPFFFKGMPISSLILLIFLYFFELFAYYNAILAIFNMIPIPPFDGSRLAFVFLPDRWYFEIMKYERYIMLILFVLLATDIITLPLSNAANSITDFFYDITSFIGG